MKKRKFDKYRIRKKDGLLECAKEILAKVNNSAFLDFIYKLNIYKFLKSLQYGN